MIEEVGARLLHRVDSDVPIGYGLEYKYILHYTPRQAKLRGDVWGVGDYHSSAQTTDDLGCGMERKGWKIKYIAPSATPRETAEEMMRWISDNYK